MNLRHCQKNSSSTTQSTEEVRGNRQSTNASTTESSSSRDNPLELLVHALLTVTGHHKSLVLELLGNIPRGSSGHLDPGLGEQSTGNQHEYDVYGSVDRVDESLLEVQRRRHVVCNTRRGIQLGGALTRFPDTEKSDKEVVREARVQHLTDKEDVGAQSGLKHDGHVRSVEETDGVRSAHATLARRLDGDLNTETLQVDDGGED